MTVVSDSPSHNFLSDAASPFFTLTLNVAIFYSDFEFWKLCSSRRVKTNALLKFFDKFDPQGKWAKEERLILGGSNHQQ